MNYLIVGGVVAVSGSLGLLLHNRDFQHRTALQLCSTWEQYSSGFSRHGNEHIHEEIDRWGWRETAKQDAWSKGPLYKQLLWPPIVKSDPWEDGPLSNRRLD